MSHQAFEELLVAHVMDDKLDELTTRDLIEHLASCESCRDLYRTLRETAVDMAFALDPQALPAGAEERLIQRIRTDAAPIPIHAARKPSRFLMVAAMVATLAVGVVGGGLVAANRSTGDDQVQRRALEVLQDPNASIARLAGSGGGQGVVAVRPTGEGVLVVSGLSPAPAGSVHELWLIADGEPVPAEVFSVVDDGANLVVALRAVPARFDAAAITIERGPRGSPRPTGDVLLSGPVLIS